MASFIGKQHDRHPDTVGALRQRVTCGDPGGQPEGHRSADRHDQEELPLVPPIYEMLENEPPRAGSQNDAENIASQESRAPQLERPQLNRFTDAASRAWEERPDPPRLRDLLQAGAPPDGFQHPSFHPAPSIQDLSHQPASAPLHAGSSDCAPPEQRGAAEAISSTKAAFPQQSSPKLSVTQRLLERFYSGILVLIIAGLSIAVIDGRIDPAARGGAAAGTVGVQQAPAWSLRVQQQLDAVASTLALVRQAIDQLDAQARDDQKQLTSIEAAQEALKHSTSALTQRFQGPDREPARAHHGHGERMLGSRN